MTIDNKIYNERVKAHICRIEGRIEQLRDELVHVSSIGRYEFIRAMLKELQEWLEYWGVDS